MNNVPHKILPLNDLGKLVAQLKDQDNTIVLCHGAFDLMHPGHIKHLQRAAQEGDILIVTITADEYITKGPGRPVFNSHVRAETLASLSCVDYVSISYTETAIEVLETIKPNVYVKGNDYKQSADDLTGNILKEKAITEENGGRIYFTDEPNHSSTKLINEYFCVFPAETRSYLDDFKSKYTSQDIINQLQQLHSKKVLVFGDAIIDEYHYTTTLGQSGKNNMIVVKYENEERFAGGAMAVANHLAGFVDEVTLVTGLGKNNSYESFIRSKLAPNINSEFFYYNQGCTLVKRRFLDQEMIKLFEVYLCTQDMNSEELDAPIRQWLDEYLDQYDIVVVPDFGNGFVTAGMIEKLVEKSKFLAVNTQINSGNRGYHVINRYPRADFVSLNEPEVRLAAHNRYDSIEQVAHDVGLKVNAKQFAITQGPRGAYFLDFDQDNHHNLPALSTKVIDRIGAGDTFLALASLCSGSGLSSDIVAFVGSAAAALDVQVVCNRESISPVSLFKYMTTLLK